MPPDPAKGQRLAIVGMLANMGLATIKLVAGLLGHSYALVADAVESMTDILGSVVIWGGLHIAAKPADREHPYGHGKAEALAALIVAAMVLAAGLGIAVKAVSEIIKPHHNPAPFTLVVLVLVVIVKEVLFRIVRRAGQESGSGAVHVDAWHHRSDAITSAAAFIGISVALWWNYPPADDIAALFAAAVIVTNGILLMRTPIHDLMDKQPIQIVDQARAIALGVPGVAGTEKMAARTVGARIRIDLHLQVDPTMSVRDAHAVSHRVKDAIMGAMPRVADVLVHIEPANQR